MRQFMTTAVEQRKDFNSAFATHPMECGWAGEALFFITIDKVSGAAACLRAKVQLSVDGVNWLDEGTVFPAMKLQGQSFVRVGHFGGWLRLACDIEGEDSLFTLTIHLVLKE